MIRFRNFALLLSLALPAPALLSAKIFLGAYPITPLPANAIGPSLFGDFNHDGVSDAATMRADGSIQVQLGLPNGFFRNGPFTPGSTPGELYAVADMNLDGKLDLVAQLNYNTPEIQLAVFLGNGDGTFRAPVLTTLANPSAAFNPGTPDLNGDGIPDLVILGILDQSVTVLLGTGTGAFTLASRSTGLSCTSSASGDFDGDGKIDLALGCLYPTLLLGRGDGTFGDPIQLDTDSPLNLVAADLNHDGRLDLVMSSTPTSGTAEIVDVYLNSGNLQFGKMSYSLPDLAPSWGYGANSFGVADLNGDGFLDIFAVSEAVDILFGSGDGTFPLAPVAYPQVAGLRIYTANFNSDESPDLIVEGYGGRIAMLGEGAGTYPNPPALTYGGGPVDNPAVVAKIDLNQDGLDDLIFSSTDSTGSLTSISTALNMGDGVFLASSLPVVQDSGRCFIFHFGACLAIKDVNGDGKEDLVYGSSTGAIQIALADTAGNLQPATTVATLPSSGGVLSVAVTDLNADGSPDIAALYLVSDANQQSALTLTVFNGDGKGTFTVGKTTVGLPFATNSPVFAPLKAGDFNGDGRGDLAYLDQSQVHVLLGNGHGTFTESFSAASLPFSLVARDLNGDGLTDLAVMTASADGNAVSVLLSSGDGSFSVAEYPIAPYPSGLTVADLDGDGFPEIIATGLGNVIMTLRNDGKGGFPQHEYWEGILNNYTILAGAFLVPKHPSLISGTAFIPIANK